MSKKLIAGAGVVASFAIALAPLATFAEEGALTTTRVDTLTGTVGTACTITLDTDSTTGVLENTYNFGTITPGSNSSTAAEAPADSAAEKKLVITCNDEDGFDVSAAITTALTHTDNSTVIPAADPAAGTSYWALKITADSGTNKELAPANGYGSYKGLTSGDVVAQKRFATPGTPVVAESFTVDYQVGASQTQKSGVYTGVITYTVAQVND